jgi:hypothetical protein
VNARAAPRGVAAFARPQRGVRRFEREVEAARVAGRADGGRRTIPFAKAAGSVGLGQSLRRDDFSMGRGVTARFRSIGRAMAQGRARPPIEVHRARPRRRRVDAEREVTEYDVVDGHHRVAVAEPLGRHLLGAHVVDDRVAPPPGPAGREVAGRSGRPAP